MRRLLNCHVRLMLTPFWTQGEIPNSSSSRNGKDTVSTPVSFTSTRRDSAEEPAPLSNTHRRAKRSVDNTKQSDRLSLFGNFGGSIVKQRKPPPRYSSGYVLLKCTLQFGNSQIQTG